MNHLAITFLYILMRCIPKSLLDDVVSESVLGGSIGNLVKMLVGRGVCSMTMTGSTASKLQNSPLTQTRSESVFAHGAEAKRKKKKWALFTLWTQLCVFSHSSWNFHTKKPPKPNISSNPNSIWNLFNRQRSISFIIYELWRGCFFSNPGIFKPFLKFIYLFYIKWNNEIQHQSLFSPYMADSQRVILNFLNMFISSSSYPILKIINIVPSWIDYGSSHLYKMRKLSKEFLGGWVTNKILIQSIVKCVAQSPLLSHMFN